MSLKSIKFCSIAVLHHYWDRDKEFNGLKFGLMKCRNIEGRTFVRPS